MEGVKRLILEIHRRSIWQVLGAYLVLSWLVFETFEVLAVGVGLPDWVEPTAAVILIVGLPAVLATASIHRPTGEGEGEAAEPAPTGAGGVGPEGAAGAEGRQPEPHMAAESAARGLGAAVDQTPPAPSAAGPARGRKARRPRDLRSLLTWRNTILGGVGAFGLLAVVTVGYMLMRSFGIGPAGTLVAQGTLDEREQIILADFESPPELAGLAQAITEGFRVDLSQSPTVRLHDQRYVSAALVRMQAQADAHLDVPLAREVAQREGVRAVVGGEIYAVGSKYVLSARLVSAEDGALLVSKRVTAANEDEIVQAVDDLSKKMRERIGEPLNSIYIAEPLEKVTTDDLDALRKYTQAVRAIDTEGDPDRGIRLLEEAVALDTSFAMAWRKLGVALGNRREERARAVEALTKTFEHRDRLTPRERHLGSAAYYSNVVGDLDASIAEYDSMLALNPREEWALNNKGNLYLELREHARAQGLFEEALAVDSFATIPFMNLLLALANQGDYAAAEDRYQEFSMWLAPDPSAEEHAAFIPAARGRLDQAAERLRSIQTSYPSSLFWKAQTSLGLASLSAVEGRLGEARRHLRDAMETDARRGLPQQALTKACRLAELELWVRGDPAAAIAVLEEALAEHPLDEIAPLDRPSLRVAHLYASAGQPAPAKQLLARFEGDVDPTVRGPQEQRDLALVEGAIAIAEGRGADAIEATRRADEGQCILCALPQLARAHEVAGDVESAIATYERYIETPYLWRVRDVDGWHLAPTHEHLGRLYEERGEAGKAAGHYARLIELWDDADEELQPRVEAARERLDVLRGTAR